jgi:hypothetical protein
MNVSKDLNTDSVNFVKSFTRKINVNINIKSLQQLPLTKILLYFSINYYQIIIYGLWQKRQKNLSRNQNHRKSLKRNQNSSNNRSDSIRNKPHKYFRG